MEKEFTVRFKLDADTKAVAEKLYWSIGLTLEEAIPILIDYNVVQEDGKIPAENFSSTMTNGVAVEIKLDAELKSEAEKIYGNIGLTLEEAIPILVRYNVSQRRVKNPDIKPEIGRTELFGALSEYANPALIPFESGAWERAVMKRYA